MIFRGSGVALVTPFVNNKVNYEKLEELIEFQITSGTDALIILGTTGENVCLSMEEKKKIIAFTAARVKNRIPVIVGTGSPNTEAVIELSKYAEYKDADGLFWNPATSLNLPAKAGRFSVEVQPKHASIYKVPNPREEV